MGNGNSSINVTLDQVQQAVYLAGDIMTGQVHFNLTERTKKIDEIYLSLTGHVGYTTTRIVRIQNGLTERKTEYYNVRIFGQKFALARSMLNESTNGDFNQTTFEPGHYKYPFSIRLPENLPPTLHPEDYPYVRYELQVLIEKKWYHSNDCHRYPIRIYPRMNLLSISNSQSAVKFGTKCKDITIKGVLQHAGLLPGEQTFLSLDIHNPSHVSIKRIDTCFVQRYEIEQCRRRLELIRLSIPELINIQDEHIEAKCPLTIPLGIPPSFKYRSQSTRKIVHVDLHYDLKLEIKAKGLFADFDVQVPVIIGTHSADHSNYNTIASSLLTTTDMIGLELADDDIPPPPYESLNCNDMHS